jgi:hypothetical protein
MILQLDPAIPMDTPRGPAYAHFLIDYGQEHHGIWVCCVCETGEWWWFSNPEVRGQRNITMAVRTGVKNG